jgi:hypothetical protein
MLNAVKHLVSANERSQFNEILRAQDDTPTVRGLRKAR